MARIQPAPGLKNWKSNPAKAVRIARMPGPKGAEAGMFGGVFSREHMSGRVDGRVGGTFVDPERERCWRDRLIVVEGIAPVTLADLELAMLDAKRKFYAHRDDPKAKAAFRALKQMLSGARRTARQTDPRRLAALEEN